MTVEPTNPDVIEGEVVDPGKLYLCEPGKAARTRAQMDRMGQYGGLVRESQTCPAGQIIAFDQDQLDAYMNEAIAKIASEFQSQPPPERPSTWANEMRIRGHFEKAARITDPQLFRIGGLA